MLESEWSDGIVEVEARPGKPRRIRVKAPPLNDDREEIVCPLCHGEGKTTGKAIYTIIDGIMGMLYHLATDAKKGIHSTFMRKLWQAKEWSEE